ncbi:zinc-dependent alcohol dehydrogenase [Kiritimatiella glycovorans]|nr:zinc-binding dehydrogenase [Kiritimatiella glycovorans]
MTAAVLREPGRLSIERVPVPEPAENEVLIRVRINTLCSATDSEVIAGIRKEGMNSILGHEMAGTVERTGSRVTRFAPGDRVTIDAWGSYAGYVCVPEDRVLPVPEALTWEEASLGELTYKVTHMALGRIVPGDTAVVLGQGPAGLLYTQFCRLSGASRVVVTDPSPMKRKLALELGADEALDPACEDLPGQVMAATGGRGGDVVIEASGRAAAAELAPRVTRPYGATIIQFGVVAEPVRYVFMRMHDKGHTLLSYGSFKDRTDRFSFERALQLLAERRIRVDRFITHTYPLSEINEAFETYARDINHVIKVRITSEEEG